MTLEEAQAQAQNLDFSNAKQQAMAQVQEQQSTENPETNTEQPAENAEQQANDDAARQNIQVQQQAEAQAQQQNVQQTQQVAQDIQSVLAENEQLKAQLAQQTQVQETMSNANEAAIVEEAMQPPQLDFTKLFYDDEETQQQKIEQYNTDLTAYNQSMAESTRKQTKDEVMKEMQPVLDKFNNEKSETERQAILNDLSGMEGFNDIKQFETPIKNLITNNDVLKNISDPVAQIMTAYTMVRGLNSMKNTGLTSDQFAEMYDKNKDFQDVIEKKRISSLNNNSQQVPPLSASQGASNSALNIPNKPKTIDEATQLLRNGMFGR